MLCAFLHHSKLFPWIPGFLIFQSFNSPGPVTWCVGCALLLACGYFLFEFYFVHDCSTRTSFYYINSCTLAALVHELTRLLILSLAHLLFSF